MRTLAADLYLLVAAYGLAIPVSYAGLPVVGQGAFMAVGAFATMLLAGHGTPLLVAVAAAVAIATLAGYLAGYAASRLAGASLALATWGLAWLVYEILVQFRDISGGSQGLSRPTPARLVSPSLGLTVVLHTWVHVLVAGLLCVAMAAILWRSGSGPWGLDWAALRTGPVLADSLGVPVQRRRRAVLAGCAGLGALGGAGTAVLAGVVAPADFSPLLSLQLFVAVLIGGVATWWGPAVGVAIIAGLPTTADHIATVFDVDPLQLRGVLTAALLIAVLAVRDPVGAWLGPRLGRTGPRPVASSPRPSDLPAVTVAGPLARVDGVVVTYDAVVALDGVDLELRPGEVHAVVGPNGSGKSTLLRVLAGVITPDAGTVSVLGDPAPHAGAAAPRVAAGVVRSLQRTATLGALPADVQVAVGARATEHQAGLGVRHLLATPVARSVAERRAGIVATSLASAGLHDVAREPAARLDSAQQRLLQISRAVATGAPALLLDEPAAGMSGRQRDHLVQVIRRLSATGRGVLLVEHDMALIGRAADRVTVLDAGRVIAHGTPAEISRHPEVRRAYLGEVN